MVRKTLNEYKWRGDKDFSLIEVQYIDRLSPSGFAILRGDDIVDLGQKFIFTKSGMIPYHRVIRILYNGEVIFERVPPEHRGKYSKKPEK